MLKERQRRSTTPLFPGIFATEDFDFFLEREREDKGLILFESSLSLNGLEGEL